MRAPDAVSFLTLDDRLRIRFIVRQRRRLMGEFQRDEDGSTFGAFLLLAAALLDTDGLRRRYRADRLRRGVDEAALDPAFQ